MPTLPRRLATTTLALTATAASLLALGGTALAAPGSANRNGHTLSASNATGLAAAGETITVTGTGYNPQQGYYVVLCQVPEDFSYGEKPGPCAGGDGQGSGGVGPSAWVTNTPIGGNPSYPIAADGSFTARIHVKQVTGGLDCGVVTCAIVSRRDHWAANNRDADVFIPATFG
ncbi:hypothetical protein [Amycolatopsis suaedae]|uniref:Uncharacterized protein n=1 Tax=Amycolatopsis suaedae TaxID=2510978 RepID=A0A4Q7IZI9_9PSEU|nr:hypothetical protein [Amycolatopsis suaedae]RZQ59909.1 hypothetical protein EWH70_31250 [Amycolatopsis suaedae]